MAQEALGPLPTKDANNVAPVWEGPILEAGVRVILDLAVATKAREYLSEATRIGR